MKNRLNNFDKKINQLALNLLDYTVDNGKLILFEEIDSKEFLSTFVSALKTKEDADVQNQILSLIQKWANKFKKYDSLSNCVKMYNLLKKNDIEFPDNYNSLYLKYIKTSNTNTKTKNKDYFEKDEG